MRGRKAKQLKPPPIDSPLPSIPPTRPCRTVALIVDLGDGPEDYEYEDFEDEFDV
jgi:hypothetical protein